jgi:hypothetical protein
MSSSKNSKLDKLFHKAIKAVKGSTTRKLGIDELALRRAKRAAASGAILSKPSRPSSGIPSQSQYEANELSRAIRDEQAVEKLPLKERQENTADFLQNMKNNPQLIGERLGWLLEGNYGKGSHMRAQQVLASPRMNQRAALCHLLAVYEFRVPGAMARAAWKKLSTVEKAALDREIDAAIAEAKAYNKENGLGYTPPRRGKKTKK